MTKGQKIAADVAALLRARNPLLWIVTREEARVERYVFEAAASAGYVARTWDCADGACDVDGSPPLRGGDPMKDPGDMLNFIKARATVKTEGSTRSAWVMRDLPSWLQGQAGMMTLRQLRNLAKTLPSAGRQNAQAIIILSPSKDVPPELAGHTTVIEWPLPDREEIAAILDAAIGSLPEFETDPTTKQPNPERPLRAMAAPNGVREAAIDAAVGLSGEEAASCYARSLVQHKRIDIPTIAGEKKRVVAREGVLEWFDPLAGGLDAVGGLDNLKAWLLARRGAYSKKAREYGLPAPKGMLLVGPPGTGKSLTAKAVATAWGVPLIRMDLGALKSKFVGESEGNLRKAFGVIEAIGRCVVWLDEVEKSLQGATSGSSDGGVSADALGAILSWMQERQGEAFVVATANDVTMLPPELLRKGRFDEMWFVDLPNEVERQAILAAALRAHGRGNVQIDFDLIARATLRFTGAEIAAIVPDALYAAFDDGGREIETRDLLLAAESVKPTSVTFSEKIAALRRWAIDEGRARPATKVATVDDRSTGRQLDF